MDNRSYGSELMDTSTAGQYSDTVMIQASGAQNLDTSPTTTDSNIWIDPTVVVSGPPPLTPAQVRDLQKLEKANAELTHHYGQFWKHLEGVAHALDLDEFNFADLPGMVRKLKEENDQLQALVEELDW